MNNKITEQITPAHIKRTNKARTYSTSIVSDQLDLPGLPPTPITTRPWPDLSEYGLYFGQVRMPGGINRLVMIDRDEAWANHAPNWGFEASKWKGLWVRKSLKFSIPKFDTLFPNAVILQLTDQEIQSNLDQHLVSRPSHRMSSDGDISPLGSVMRMSWHPSRQIKDNEPVPLEIPTLSAIGQSKYLGLNFKGAQVYEMGDGSRFLQTDDETIIYEDDSQSEPSLFLRLGEDDDNLSLCAIGLILELKTGKVLHASDFERYLNAIYGQENVAENHRLADQLSNAIDDALIAEVALKNLQKEDESYLNALTLHEGRPSYFRAEGNLPTPLPMSFVMQKIASVNEKIKNGTVLDISQSTRNTNAHSWNIPQAKSVNLNEIENHDVMIGGIFSKKIDVEIIDGLSIARADHKAIIESLKVRSNDGLSVFLITAENKIGTLDGNFKRLLVKIGSEYDINALVDIDPRMISPGNAVPSRLLVIGQRLSSQNYSFETPLKTKVIYDYEELWSWTQDFCHRISLTKEHSFGLDKEEDRKDNKWQAPYIPSSQISEPQSMSPRNLLGPVRKALAKIEKATQLSTDEFVAKNLQWTIDEMAQYLDSEQVDAVALAINAMENGHGLIEGDATGLGKGRILSATMRYRKLKEPNAPMIFLTKTEDLFNDIYRDINDIGSLSLFKNPLILNSGVELITPSGEKIGKSLKKNDMTNFLLSESCEGQFILSTYTQFNRKLATHSNIQLHIAANEIQLMIASGMTRIKLLENICKIKNYQALLGGELMLDEPRLTSIKSNNQKSITEIKNILSNVPKGNEFDSPYRELRNQLTYREISNEDFLKKLDFFKLSNAELRLHWLKGDALKNAITFADEAHIAAGPTSQTNEHIKDLVRKSNCSIYSSATFAKGLNNYEVYASAFPPGLKGSDVNSALAKGGPALQEIFSAMLAEDGRMIRREHDLSNIDFRFMIDKERVERNLFWADSLANILSLMSVISGDIEDYVNEKNSDAMDVIHKAAILNQENTSKLQLKAGLSYSNFASGFYNLNRTFMMAVNADYASDLAIQSLSEGRKPVITVENTGEAALKKLVQNLFMQKELDADDDGDGFFGEDDTSSLSAENLNSNSIDLGKKITFRDVLTKYVDNLFYGWEWENQVINGVTQKIKTRVSLKLPGMDEAEAQIKKMILGVPDIPISPIDVVRDNIRNAGYSVDEISGRSVYLKVNSDGTHSVEKFKPRSKKELQDDFNSGRLDAIILTKAGSTGISLHASEKFEDQSQRELIELQPAADIVERLQFWGRVKRKGEVCLPRLNIISAGLPGELRLQTQQNAHLRKLSANISGNADSSYIDTNAPDILNSIGNEVCYRWIENNPKEARYMGIKLDVEENKAGFRADGNVVLHGTRFVDLLTLRALLLNTTKQRIFNETIINEFNSLVEQYEVEGRNPLKSGSLDIRADKGESVLFESVLGIPGSVFTNPVNATELKYEINLDGLDPLELQEKIESSSRALSLQFANSNDSSDSKFYDDEAMWIMHLTNRLKDAFKNIAPSLLSKRHLTVAEALIDSSPNAVKNMNEKISFITHYIERYIPGSLFKIKTDKFNDETFLVLSMSINEDRLISPSEYRLNVISLESRNKQSFSLSTIMNLQGSIVDISSPIFNNRLKSSHNNLFARALKNISTPYSEKVTRVIYENNLFHSANIVAKSKIGRAISYTDKNGMWHQAFLLPTDTRLDHINELEVIVNNEEVMSALLLREKTIRIYDQYNSDHKKFELTNEGGVIALISRGSEEVNKWLLKSEELQPFFLQSWEGKSRKLKIATINPHKINEFCKTFLELTDKNGFSNKIIGSNRQWVNEFIQNRNSSLMTNEFEDLNLDDIDDQLKTMKL